MTNFVIIESRAVTSKTPKASGPMAAPVAALKSMLSTAEIHLGKIDLHNVRHVNGAHFVLPSLSPNPNTTVPSETLTEHLEQAAKGNLTDQNSPTNQPKTGLFSRALQLIHTAATKTSQAIEMGGSYAPQVIEGVTSAPGIPDSLTTRCFGALRGAWVCIKDKALTLYNFISELQKKSADYNRRAYHPSYRALDNRTLAELLLPELSAAAHKPALSTPEWFFRLLTLEAPTPSVGEEMAKAVSHYAEGVQREKKKSEEHNQQEEQREKKRDLDKILWVLSMRPDLINHPVIREYLRRAGISVNEAYQPTGKEIIWEAERSIAK